MKPHLENTFAIENNELSGPACVLGCANVSR